jgi:hypothetical protein
MSIQVIINQKGPLPIKATFQSIGDQPMYIEVNGSVWTQQLNTMIGIEIDVDGNKAATAYIFSNGTATHRTVVPAYIPVKLAQGQHTLTLKVANTQTVSDYNDYYTAVIHY